MALDVGGIPMIQTGSSNGDGMFGGGGAGILGIILIIALLGGGFGGLGNRGTEAAAVDNTVWQSQQLAQIDGSVRAVGQGICSSTYDLNNSIKDGNYSTAMAIQESKYQIGNGICNSTFGITTAINGLGTQMQNCCCSIERGIDGVNFNAERNTNAIVQSANANTQRILDYLNCKELADKNQQIFEMSQKAQTFEIVAAMKPREAMPAYLQPSPYEAYRVNPVCGGGCNGAFV